MEVAIPSPEFHFHAPKTTPSSPRLPQNRSSIFEFHHNRHISTPNSPAASSTFQRHVSRRSSIPFNWEDIPGTPKSSFLSQKADGFDTDANFDFHNPSQIPLPPSPPPSAAVESAESKKARPLKLPPRLCSSAKQEQGSTAESLQRRGRKDEDPFAVAMAEATKSRRGRGGSFLKYPPPMAEKSTGGWKSRLAGFFPFQSEQKKKKECYDRGSSSSSTSSNSPAEEKKSAFGIGNFTTGKLAMSFNPRRS